jgi:hypothetical protein
MQLAVVTRLLSRNGDNDGIETHDPLASGECLMRKRQRGQNNSELGRQAGTVLCLR